MKSLSVVCLLALTLVPHFARAETYIDPWMLGVVEGAVDYCVRVDPRNAGRLQDLERNVLNGLPKNELSSARSTKGYDVGQSLGKGMYADLPKAASLANCADFTNHFMAEIGAGGGKDTHGERDRSELARSEHDQSEHDRGEKESGERR